MTIVRDGKEYALTEDELFRAYLEQEHIYDVEDVKSELELIIDNDMDEPEFVEAAKRIYVSEELLDSTAASKRRNIDKHNMEWSFAVSEAVRDAVCIEMDA